jgi:ABC-2 type transport system permease protein
LFWLTIFGFLFEKKIPVEGGSYLAYLLPGICAMTVLQSSSQSGILYIKDFQTDFFGRYNFTPLSKVIALFFKIFADYTRIIIQVFILLIIGHLIGVSDMILSASGMMKLILATFLFTYFYASIACFIALKTKTSELMATFVNLFNLPVIFTSTALVPNKGLPNWLENIAKYNPLSHLSDIIRKSIIQVDFNSGIAGNSFLILTVLAITCFTATAIYIHKIKYD